MKYILHDFQKKAATEVLANIKRARRDATEGNNDAFALTAVTGAGKTVIATSVIESLFNGTSGLDDTDDGNLAIVWLTNDENLNRQTRHNMIDASSDLQPAQLVSIGDGSHFNQELFTRGHVYFLNVQKLYDKSTSWSKKSDSNPNPLWEIFANTINANKESGGTQLLVIIDEAHRGIGKEGKPTTLARLISGDVDTNQPPLPIVWGISATPKRFQIIMDAASSRTVLSAVQVDTNAVRDSGLLKDYILLDAPQVPGPFDTTMLSEAVRQTIAYEKDWADYATREQDYTVVKPVLVFQVGNTPDFKDLAAFHKVITETWASESGEPLPASAVVNVFGEHQDLHVPTRGKGPVIPYMSPEDIQNDNTIRVVFAKDAITTGWDCPRAEVLCSLRASKDDTTIAQMIGRMVRTPRARSIKSNQNLNTVTCFLPNFNREAVDNVISKLTKAGDDEIPVNAIERSSKVTLSCNPNLGSDLSSKIITRLESIPSETLPRLNADNAVTRSKSFATKAVKQWPNEKCLAEVDKKITSKLESLRTGRKPELDAMIEGFKHAELSRSKYAVDGSSEFFDPEARSISIDANNVEDAYQNAYKAALKLIPEGVISDYADYLYDTFVKENSKQSDKNSEWAECDHHDTQRIAAMTGLLPANSPHKSAAKEIELVCEELLRDFDNQTKKARQDLGEKDRELFDDILSSSRKPELIFRKIPVTSIVTKTEDATPWDRHILATNEGDFPFKGTTWERRVLYAELNTSQTGGGAIAWYRNPSASTTASLSIPYATSGDGRADALADPTSQWTSLQPDFIIIRGSDKELTVSIVDPHGTHLSDAVPKIKALAEYAKRCEELPEGKGGFKFSRIASIAENSKKDLVFLDLTKSDVRNYVLNFTGTDAVDMFKSTHAEEYIEYQADDVS